MPAKDEPVASQNPNLSAVSTTTSRSMEPAVERLKCNRNAQYHRSSAAEGPATAPATSRSVLFLLSEVLNGRAVSNNTKCLLASLACVERGNRVSQACARCRHLSRTAP